MRWLATILIFLASSPAARADDAIEPIRKAAERANQQGEYRRAAGLYTSVLPRIRNAPPDQQRAVLSGLLGTCRALIHAKQHEPALRTLVAMLGATRPAPGDAPPDPDLAAEIRSTLEQLAFELVIAQKPALAEQGLEALMADGPGSAMRWALLSRAHIEQGEFDRASQTLKRGLALYPAAPQLLFVRAALAGALSERAVARANYLAAERMLLRAVRDLEKAAEAEPDVPGIQRALGKILGSLWVYYRATGQFDRSTISLRRAEEAFERAALLDPADPDVTLELAKLLFTAQDWDWAVRTYRMAARRYQALRAKPDLTPVLRQVVEQQLTHCQEQIAHCLQRRAQSAAAAGQFGRARQLIQQAAAERPAFRRQAPAVLAALERTERAHLRTLRKLQGQPDAPDAQRALGDLWVASRQFDRAAAAYRRGLAHAQGQAVRRDLEARLAAVEQVPDTSLHLRFQVGQLEVEADLPPALDAGRFRNSLERAHALTMAVFPHRLIGPLSLKVFANQRLFLERAGVAPGPEQKGLYAFGRVVTYDEKDRNRAEWLDILVHEIAHRYVDEMTYDRAPRWLSEGLAQWASERFGPARQRRFESLVRSGGLLAWRDMDPDDSARWVDPGNLATLYLQSHQVVDWLMRRFGSERVMTLLAGLRQGQTLDEAAWMAFGTRLEQLEGRWRREIGGR